MLALVTFLVPVFAGVFEEFGGELPLITRVTVAASDIVKGFWYALIAGTAGASSASGSSASRRGPRAPPARVLKRR